MTQRDELDKALSELTHASRLCGRLHERGSLTGPLGGETERRFSKDFSAALMREAQALAALRAMFTKRDCAHPCHECAGLDACREAVKDALSV